MANTYTSLHYHIVFSTKNRVPYIKAEIEQRVWEYIGGVARHHDLTALQVGGIDEHIHALIMASPTIAPSQIAQWVKGESSKWIHETFPALRSFAWQEGYGAFTVSKSGLTAVVRYIQNQRAHHQQRDFQAEYLDFLQKHAVEYDERYLWG
jgi:REP element-mobilizing transposase RayT